MKAQKMSIAQFLLCVYQYANKVSSTCLYTFVEDTGHFELQWKRQFAYPLHSISYEDITRDGVKEMVVLSTAGVHILQVASYSLIVDTNICPCSTTYKQPEENA